MKQKGTEKDADRPLVNFSLAFSSLIDKLKDAAITMFNSTEDINYGEVLMKESLLKVAQLEFFEACMAISKSALPIPQSLDYLKELQVNGLRQEYSRALKGKQGGNNGKHQKD